MNKVSKQSDNTVSRDCQLTITIQVINIIYKYKYSDNNITKKMRLSCKEIKKEMDKICFPIFDTSISFQKLYDIGKLDKNTFNTLSNITQLYFETCYISSIDMANKLAKLIELCPLINVIHLDDVIGYNDNIFKIIANKLGNCIKLQMLTLSSNNITSDGLKELCYNIIKCKQIHTFNISDNGFGTNSDVLVQLANTLKNLECLSSLDIGNNHLDDIGFAAVTAALPNCLKLSSLNLSNIDISKIGLGILASVLPMCRELETLDFSNNELRLIGITKFTSILPLCLKLKSLDISDNELGEIGINILASVLPQCQVLSSIKIGSNDIRTNGLYTFTKAIINSNLRSRLSTLDISNTNISDSGISILKDFLPKCLVLSNLNLSNTCKDITFSGLKSLAKTFILCEQLSYLNITSNNFSDKKLQIIVNVFPYCESLKLVTITINNDESMQIIKNVFTLCERLKIICKK
jgi:Ran GTPase-activating protein (RanGAP) involved in mRNA processing and transport